MDDQMKSLRAFHSSLKNMNENNILYREKKKRGKDGVSFQNLWVKLNWINNLFPIQNESAWQPSDSEVALGLRQWNGRFSMLIQNLSTWRVPGHNKFHSDIISWFCLLGPSINDIIGPISLTWSTANS